MTSTRLPGKILLPILGRPMMAYQLQRLARTRADELVLATTTNETDNPVAALATSWGWRVTRGSEDDVLGRYVQAAGEVDASVIVRSTADCPLIDPAIVDEGIERFAGVDYLAAMGLPDGMGFEVFSRALLERLDADSTEPAEREHVTLRAYTHPEDYRIGGWEVTPDRSGQRWTVDTAEDFEVVRRIITALLPDKPRFTIEDVAEVMAQHPDWSAINAAVTQQYAQVTSTLYERIRADALHV